MSNISSENQDNYSLLREYKQKECTFEMLNRFGAHSVGIGRKVVQGRKTKQLSLRFYVAKKVPFDSLDTNQLIPESISFRPSWTDKESLILTDIIETPPMHFEQIDPESRVRPVPGGVSGGSGETGTIGGWVLDNTDNSIVMLSNEHVFGSTTGIDIIQPGSENGGSSPTDKIGNVKRGIARSSTSPNIVDCAIGDPDNTDIFELSALEIGPAVHAIQEGVEDMRVEKYGRTTRHTFGEIEDADWSGTVDGLTFNDCILIDVTPPSSDWSAKGDSGSLVFSQTPISLDSDIKPVVGLHFAGNGTAGVACKIQNVFSALELTTLSPEFLTSGSPMPEEIKTIS